MSIIEERMRITQKIQRMDFDKKLKKNCRKITVYWQLHNDLDICESNLEQIIEIESELGLSFLKQAKLSIVLPSCYF